MADALDLIGYLNFVMGKYPQALAAYSQGLKVADSTHYPLRHADLLLKMGFLYHDNEDIIKALQYYEACLKIYQKMEDSFGIGAIYNEYGSIYKDKGAYEKSLDYFLQSVQINDNYSDEFSNTSVYNNIGDLYLVQKEYTKSLDYFKKSLALSVQKGDKLLITSSLAGIANVYAGQGKYELALAQFEKCLIINEEIDFMLGSSDTYIDMGNIFVDQKMFGKSIAYFQAGFELAEDLGDIGNQESASDGLYRAHKALGQEMKALSHLEQALYFKDSIKSEQTSIRLQQLEFRKQVQADSLIQIKKDLSVEMHHQAEVRIKDRNRNLAIGFGLFFLVMSGGLYSRWSYIKKSKAIIELEKDRSENLLLNILPAEIAEELKEKGEAEARDFDLVSILFTDFKGFTKKSEQLSAKELIEEINICFKAFDLICEKHGIEKIKTIGDAYMAAGGVPVNSDAATKNTVLAALEMQRFVSLRFQEKEALKEIAFEMRLGIHTGPAVAGIVGVKKFQYDIWGDTVNTAARMESSGQVGQVNISQQTYELIKGDSQFNFKARGKIEAKGKGEIEMWFVESN